MQKLTILENSNAFNNYLIIVHNIEHLQMLINSLLARGSCEYDYY